MYKWTYDESAQQLANEEIEQLHILNTPSKPLYHYTSREVFWLIMESETFLARHIKFSNDYQENEIGTKMIEQAMQEAGMTLSEVDALPFMICFCEKGDLLSQWRGYAKEGVAMEFDFSKGLYGMQEEFSSYYCYTIMNKDTEKKKGEMTYISESLIGDEKLCMGAIVSPYSVIYTGSVDEVAPVVRENIEKIKNDSVVNKQQHVIGMIPYIKNDKFLEECEYRLLFDMKQFTPGLNQHLLQEKYVYLDVDGIKKPNIRVKFGNQEEIESDGVIKVYYSNNDWTDSLAKLKDELGKEDTQIELISDCKLYPMQEDEIVLSSGKKQEIVAARIRSLLAQSGTSVRVWCDGHLPLRRVIVGPSKDAELMKCSIEEYLKTKYWAQDIKVDISAIPLRT
ncbi:MAG: DUF2971 domain-containing protein [Roseburia sp.]|nr:DUF2971 domain-containing protein [Roseburia sp.]